MLKSIYCFCGLRKIIAHSSRTHLSIRITSQHKRLLYQNFCTSVLASSEPTTPAVDENEDFDNFIDEIRKSREADSRIDKVTKYLSIKTFDGLLQVLKTDRPSNSIEASGFLFALSRNCVHLLESGDHIKNLRASKMKNWLRSEDFCSMVNAQILSDETRFQDLLTSLSALLNLLGKDSHEYKNLSTDHQNSKSITPTLTDILNSLIKRVEKVLYGDLNVKIGSLILLHTRIRQTNLTLNPEFNDALHQVLMSKVSEAESSDLASLFLYLDPHKEATSVTPLLQRIEHQLPVMTIGVLVSLLQSWFIRMKIEGNFTWRNHSLIKMIVQTIAKYRNFDFKVVLFSHEESLTVQQMIALCNVNSGWISNDVDELIPKICDSYCLNWQLFKKWADVSTMANYFGKQRVTYRQPWKCLIKWVHHNISSADSHIPELSLIFSSCTLANVDKLHLSTIANRLALKLDPLTFSNDLQGATKWLNVVHTLAAVDALTLKLVKTILNPNFIKYFESKDGKREYSQKTPDEVKDDFSRFYNISKILQINFVAKHGKGMMDEKYQGNTIMQNKLVFENNEYITMIMSKLKFGKLGMEKARSFRNNLNVYCESGQLRLAPFLDLTTGVYIDSAIYWDPDKQMPLSVKQSHNWAKVQKVAILYFQDSHMTKRGTGEGDPSHIRLLGPFQFQVYILQKAGYRVIVIAEKDLQAYGTTPGQHLEYITNELKDPSGKYQSNVKWGDLDLDEFVKYTPKKKDLENVKSTLAIHSNFQSPNQIFRKFLQNSQKQPFQQYNMSKLQTYTKKDPKGGYIPERKEEEKKEIKK